MKTRKEVTKRQLYLAAKKALEIAESHIKSEYEGTDALQSLLKELDPVRITLGRFNRRSL